MNILYRLIFVLFTDYFIKKIINFKDKRDFNNLILLTFINILITLRIKIRILFLAWKEMRKLPGNIYIYLLEFLLKLTMEEKKINLEHCRET